MKKIAWLLLASLIFLTGCSMIKEDDPNQSSEYQTSQLMQEVDLTPSITISPVLYFWMKRERNSRPRRVRFRYRKTSVPKRRLSRQ